MALSGTRFRDYIGRRLARMRPRAFLSDRAGSVVILFAIAAPVLALSAGAAIDYARLSSSRASLQTIADGAAIAGAQALRLANATSVTVDQAVARFVASRSSASDPPITVTTSLTAGNTIVNVQASRTTPAVVNNAIGLLNMRTTVNAQARAVGK